MSLKRRLRSGLERYRNPQHDENEKEVMRRMGFVRLLIFVPFLIAAIIFFLLSQQ